MGTEGVLHFLNEILYKLKQGSFRDAQPLSGNLARQFESIRQFISDTDSLIQTDIGVPQIDSSIRGGCRILGLAEEAIEELAVRPKSIQATQIVLKILKANFSLPIWHPASMRIAAAPKTADRTLPAQEDAKFLLPLIIDKVIEVVLGIAGEAWRSGMNEKIKHPAWERISLKPVDQGVLESVLLDQNVPPRIRSIAAALLRMLAHAFPSARLSASVEFHSGLFLTQFPPGPLDHWPDHQLGPKLIDNEEKVQLLLEAFDQKSDHVRWNASAACYQAAVDHPEWFQPKHHIRLLSLLSDSHYGVRLNIVRTFKVLAGHRDQGMAQVTHDISKRLHEDIYGAEDRAGGLQGLEAAAFAVIFDSLMQQIHELQQEVQQLERRRKTLLNGIERQSTRIGEEIHHEILNTRCGYLATSIDEMQHAESKKQLLELVADLRRIMNNLYPQDLDAQGFLATIKKRLEDAKRQLQRQTPDFCVELSSPDVTDEDILKSLRDKSHIVLLYRIVLEAIINARKHSGGTFVAVKVQRLQDGIIDISVSDDGGGDGGPFQENVGIPLVRQRADEIGARIEYKRTSSKGGTTLVIRLFEQAAASRREE
jgi:signal transduction histidine kinase